ncbi:tetratricopeptide repeat protein [Rhodopirellula sp. JC740]|uniref:Tetratricopeptide repeat protein n=1 Tax=Rhodopirellula halodulae TaxID=2894198 RepID=A0ABS8NKL9_9BACT|nr:tetratricopeptide repeat protein [Rhodopirellula sp. JC740]MCC9643363.1 tetratricopeptide repeat protein [Rhodopirellula sp. JC740]
MKNLLFVLFCVAISVPPCSAQEGASAISGSTQGNEHAAQPLLDKAVEAFKSGDGQTAIQLLASAHAQHQDLPPGEVMFARLAFAAGKSNDGHNALQRAAASDGQDPEVWSMLGELSLSEGRVAEAEVLFQRSLELVQTYSADQNRKKRLKAKAHAGLATIYQRWERLESAKTHLRDWIEIDERNEVAWNQLATVYFQLEKYDIAKQTLVNLNTFAKQPTLPDTKMGRMYQAIGKHELAKRSMESAIEVGAEDLQTQIEVALWAMTSGEQDMMKQCVETAKALNADSPAVKAMDGTVERFEGDFESAEAVFGDLHRDNPGSFDAVNGLALSLLSQNDEKKATLALRHAEMLVKTNTDLKTQKGRAAAATYAWALMKNGKSKEANAVIRQAVQAGEFSPEVGYFAAVIFESVGELQLAKQFIQAAMNSSVAFPQKEEGQALLERLTD